MATSDLVFRKFGYSLGTPRALSWDMTTAGRDSKVPPYSLAGGEQEGQNLGARELVFQRAKWPQSMAHEGQRHTERLVRMGFSTDRQRVMPPALLLAPGQPLASHGTMGA